MIRAFVDGVYCLQGVLRHAHQGKILAEVAKLAEAGRLTPLLNKQRFTTADIAAAHALVEQGALGKVVVEIQS